VLIAACGMCALAPGAAVGGTLDQQQLLTDGLEFAHASQSLAQTVTAGLSGGIDQVDLMLRYGAGAPTAPLSVEIRNVSAGSPGATVLASGSVPAAAVTTTSTFLPITFATPAPVTAGTQFAIVAYSSTPNTNSFAWARSTLDPYTGGSHFYAAPSPPWNPVAGKDMTFKTYVVPNTFSFSVKGKKLLVAVEASGKVEVRDARAARGATAANKKRKKKLLLKRSSASGGPGTIVVPLRLTKRANGRLMKKRQVSVGARITFTPEGGLANTQTAPLKIKAKKRKKNRK